jgi:hypothetical protein
MKLGLVTAVLLSASAIAVFTSSAALASSNERISGPGTVGIRLVAATGAPSNNPLANPYIVARMAPGDILTRTIEIDDDSKASIDVALYAEAAKVVNGHFVFAAGSTSNDLTSWTSVANDAIRLAPYSVSRDTVTTRVPSDAASGNLYAVIWAAVAAAPPGGNGITLVSRVGVRMYVAVGPGGGAPSNFGLGTLNAKLGSSGNSLIVTQVHNSGANTLDLNGFFQLSKGPGGLDAGPFLAKLGVVLAPGASEPISVALAPNFPLGPWKAVLKVSSGLLSRSTTRTITFPGRFASVTPSQSGPGVIQISLLLFALFAVASLVLMALHRSRRRP